MLIMFVINKIKMFDFCLFLFRHRQHTRSMLANSSPVGHRSYKAIGNKKDVGVMSLACLPPCSGLRIASM